MSWFVANTGPPSTSRLAKRPKPSGVGTEVGVLVGRIMRVGTAVDVAVGVSVGVGVSVAAGVAVGVAVGGGVTVAGGGMVGRGVKEGWGVGEFWAMATAVADGAASVGDRVGSLVPLSSGALAHPTTPVNSRHKMAKVTILGLIFIVGILLRFIKICCPDIILSRYSYRNQPNGRHHHNFLTVHDDPIIIDAASIP